MTTRFALCTRTLIGSALLALLGTACQTSEAPVASAAESRTPAATAPSTTAAAVASVGATAPDFTLVDVNGKEHSLSAYTKAGKLVVLEWFNPDCPYTVGYHTPTNQMAQTAKAYEDRGVVWLAINSGAAGKQGAGLERNRKAVTDFGLSFPVLLDESGKTGRSYAAKTTPHMFVIDTQGVLRYAGGIDDGGKPGGAGARNLVVAALDEILAGKAVSTPTAKPFGCSVKYSN
ncbi:MAG: thioredoxin family protein [Planctomycetota bacterium]